MKLTVSFEIDLSDLCFDHAPEPKIQDWRVWFDYITGNGSRKTDSQYLKGMELIDFNIENVKVNIEE